MRLVNSAPRCPSSTDSESAERYSCALHEVSNALTVILGWLELAENSGSRADLTRALEVAREHAQRGQVIARRAIGSSVESQQGGRSAQSIGTFAAVSVEPSARAKRVKIDVKAGAGTEASLDGEAAVLQILTNLLLNAIAFSPDDAVISLEILRQGDAVRFIVTDQGPGVPAALREGLFSSRASLRPGGAGIGLPHSRTLAVEHGGTLELASSKCGACFEVTWPVVRSSAPQSAFPPALRAALEGARILVIEDDPAVSTLVEMSLEARGAELILASGYDQLCAILAGMPVVDLVLMDLSPIVDELREVIAELNSVCPDAPIVLMSGQPGRVPSDLEGAFSTWIRKPFDMGQLTQVVAESIAERSALHSA